MNPSFIGGGTVGVNWQPTPYTLLGLENNFGYMNIKGSIAQDPPPIFIGDTIAKAKLINGNDSVSKIFREKALARSQAMDKYFWNKQLSFFTDYNFKTQKQNNNITPAGLYPFCFINEKPDYMSFLGTKVAAVLKEKLLKPGGFATTEYTTGEQWDAPNGWAPLEWMIIWGLDRCGQKDLASDAAIRWMKLNIKSYKQSGKLMEKYNVVSVDKEAGGGEYPGQDGFGWTNGVLLKLISVYGMPKE